VLATTRGRGHVAAAVRLRVAPAFLGTAAR
jgi:hypothetical protein